MDARPTDARPLGERPPVVAMVETPTGPARVSVVGPPGRPVGTLALGHGAGGGIEAVDLVAVSGAAVEAGWRVLLVEQPWRVAGRRVAAAPPRLDVAWTACLGAVLDEPERRGRGRHAGHGRPGMPLVLGGRSAGARVACRTASELGADGVLALAFPLHPPGRPERSRAAELTEARDRVGAGVLVVQGRRDAFGTPQEVLAAVPGVQVDAVDGDHSLKADPDAVARAAARWLATLVRS